MSSNLLKRRFTRQKDEGRVIEVNERMEERLEELTARRWAAGSDGFVSGLAAEEIELVEGAELEVAEGEEAFSEGIVQTRKAADAEAGIQAAAAEAERIVADARAEAERIIQDAKKQAERERSAVLEEARQQGYARGEEQANAAIAGAEEELREKWRMMEEEYQQLEDELEPQLVEVITGIYEHIFNVELQGYRDILCHLIASAMRKIEGGRDFLIHVSTEDYPYVNMQKKQIMSVSSTTNCVVEIIEDMTLSKNECLIETEGGIFDCSLGVELAELRQKLILLSYEQPK